MLSDAARLFTTVDRATTWSPTAEVGLNFRTHHPQGMALVDDRIFLSSVEVLQPPERRSSEGRSGGRRGSGYDRSPGRGRGHVFVISRDGKLIKDIALGAGDVYHPGGIDFDGDQVWVPVAEYRPHSTAIIYTIDPQTYAVTERFRHDDHVGALVYDRQASRPTGVSWGSRNLLTWNDSGELLHTVDNRSHFLDYQDAQYAGAGHQLCTGVTSIDAPTGPVELGGAALVELAGGRIVHEVPFQLYSAAGHAITRNPVSFEADGEILRMYAAPDDGHDQSGTTLYVFEARPTPAP